MAMTTNAENIVVDFNKLKKQIFVDCRVDSDFQLEH